MAERIPGGRDGPFPASATALLLVDMQRIWLAPGRNPGHPDWGEDHPYPPHVAGQTIPNQRGLLHGAPRPGGAVINTNIRHPTSAGPLSSLAHQPTPLHIPHHYSPAATVPTSSTYD